MRPNTLIDGSFSPCACRCKSWTAQRRSDRSIVSPVGKLTFYREKLGFDVFYLAGFEINELVSFKALSTWNVSFKAARSAGSRGDVSHEPGPATHAFCALDHSRC